MPKNEFKKKNRDVDKITPTFGFQRIVLFHPGASTNKHKIKFWQNCFAKMVLDFEEKKSSILLKMYF